MCIFVETKSGGIAVGRASNHPMNEEAPCPGPQEQHAEYDSLNPDDDVTSQSATANPFDLLHTSDEEDNEDLPCDNRGAEETTCTLCSTIPEEAAIDNHGPQLHNLNNPMPCVPNMLNRLITAARDIAAAPTRSSGARIRSRQVLRLIVGQPGRVKQHKSPGRPPEPQLRVGSTQRSQASTS